jgi:hypothetical protein
VRVRVEVGLKKASPAKPRHELKMVTARAMLPRVESWLRRHPDGFYVRYPPREVNNVYFDTPHLHRFVENLGGASERRKVRLRWYGLETSDVAGVFEIKCKRNKLGWKISQRLERPLDFEGLPWAELVAGIRAELNQELRLHLDMSGEPVLINRYHREYYLSADGAVRITLDYDLRAYDQRGVAVPNLRFGVPVPDDLVVELKAPYDQGDRLRWTLESIPLRVTKRSKYALGVASGLGY